MSRSRSRSRIKGIGTCRPCAGLFPCTPTIAGAAGAMIRAWPAARRGTKRRSGPSRDRPGVMARNRFHSGSNPPPSSRPHLIGISVTPSSPGLLPRWPRNSQNPADSACCSLLDLVVPWNRCLGKVRWIQPDIVVSAVMVQEAAMFAKMLFQSVAVHWGRLTRVTWWRPGGASV